MVCDSFESARIKKRKRGLNKEMISRVMICVTMNSDLIQFRHSPIHGMGCFALTNIPKGTRIIDYVGQKISKAESLVRCEENNAYIFSLDEDFDLDGNAGWNPAKFINHSCAPNCEAELDEGRIWIVTLQKIKAAEEITFNYGYDLENYKEHPCGCGAKDCVGFIVAEEFFDHLQKQETTRKVGAQSIALRVS